MIQGMGQKLVNKALKGLAAKTRIVQVMDAIQNVMTGQGTARSKTTWNRYSRGDLLTNDELETLWQDNDIARTIVSEIVETSLRAGFHLKRHNGNEAEDADRSRAILEKYKALGAPRLVQEGACWGRLFGAGGLILGVKGGGDLSTPLDDTKVTDVEMLLTWDRQDLTPVRYYPNGNVEVYMWTPPPTAGAMTRQPVEIHETRLLQFEGAKTTPRGEAANQGWPHSVLQAVLEVLKSFDSMLSSTDAMFADASQAVFKLQGLIQSLAEADDGNAGAGGTADVQTRLQLLDLMRSATRAIMLDAGDETGAGEESFEVVDRTSLGGLDGIVNQYFIRLACAARQPLTILLGMSPAGMDATGESDMIIWFNRCDVYRQYELAPGMTRLVRMCARAVGDADPDDWEICWPELARPKPLDVQTGEKMRVDTAVALITSQVAQPEEIALSLGRIAPTLGLDLDLDARQKALKAAMAEVASRDVIPEDEPPAPVAAPKSSERKTPSKTAGKQV